jgi:hypothetical protein
MTMRRNIAGVGYMATDYGTSPVEDYVSTGGGSDGFGTPMYQTDPVYTTVEPVPGSQAESQVITEDVINIPTSTASVATPEQLYINGQVVDESGNPLIAGYFGIDQNSQQTTTQAETGQDGFFTIVIPEVRADRWVNFFSDGKTPVVKSWAELYQDGAVVLHPATQTDNASEGRIALLGAGALLLIIAAKRKKKYVRGVSEMWANGKRIFKKQSTASKIAIVGAGGLALYLVGKALLHAGPTAEQKRELTGAADKLKELGALGIFPSPGMNFQSLANEIVTAVDDCGTDEDTIYSVFRQLNNEADLYSLILSYGVSSYKGCFEGSYFGNVSRTLSQTIAAELDSSEKTYLNNILASHGDYGPGMIQYRF